MIITEYCFVTEDGRSSDHQISITDDDKISGPEKNWLMQFMPHGGKNLSAASVWRQTFHGKGGWPVRHHEADRQGDSMK